MRKVVTLVAMLSVLLLLACQPPAPTPTPITPRGILDRAAARMDKVNSMHFELAQEGGGTPLMLGLEMKRADGDVVRPDKLQVLINTTFMGMAVDVKLTTVGDQTFITNPLTRRDEPITSDFKVLSVFNPDTGIKAVLEAMNELSQREDEQLDGRACYRIGGKVPSKTLQPFTLNFVEGAVADAEVWVDKQDFVVRQAKFTGRLIPQDQPTMVRTLKLSRFDENIDIKLPR